MRAAVPARWTTGFLVAGLDIAQLSVRPGGD
jgi:hypothetical protein